MLSVIFVIIFVACFCSSFYPDEHTGKISYVLMFWSFVVTSLFIFIIYCATPVYNISKNSYSLIPYEKGNFFELKEMNKKTYLFYQTEEYEKPIYQNINYGYFSIFYNSSKNKVVIEDRNPTFISIILGLGWISTQDTTFYLKSAPNKKIEKENN